MIDRKALFQNRDLRCGGFYELCLQVCPSKDQRPIQCYTDYIWTLDNVDGPYDSDFNKIAVDIEQFEHQGILSLGDYSIPFKTFNIREQEPIETGFNWFDISFYTTAIESVFGQEYQTWTEVVNCPPVLHGFLIATMKRLYAIHPFRLALIDFEVSGQYYLDDLKKGVIHYPHGEFYIGKADHNEIKDAHSHLQCINLFLGKFSRA